jgi:hypothetical protein
MVVGNPKSTSNSKSVSEKIDERILRLLGLEDVFDLDYETYITLLKEILVKSVVTGKNKLAAEEVDLLKEELKRVKGKGNVGRFKVKEKKVSVSGIKGINITNKNYILNQSNNIISPQKLLPAAGSVGAAAAEVSDKSKTLGDEFENNIAAIRKSVESIAAIFADQFKFQTKIGERERRDAEGRRRGARESELEKPLKILQKVVDNILAPVKSIWEKILNFLVQTILGRIVFKLIDWFANPNNAKKIRSLIRFFGDWWPALLGAYILFGTSFGKFTSSILGIVGSGLLKLTKFAIPQLLKFLKSPVGIAAGLFTAGATVPMLFPGTVDDQERKTDKSPGSNADKIKELERQKAALSWFEQLQGKGSEIDEQIGRLKTGQTKSYGFSGGGLASGFVSGQKGTDKIPAMLSDGEFVMSVGAVKKYGVETLEGMNAAGGGTNKPREIAGTVYAAGGGLVGNYPSGFSGKISDVRPIVEEIVKQLAPQYKWAQNLANKAGISVSGVGQNLYNSVMNQGVGAQRSLSNINPNDLGNQAMKYGGGLLNQSMKYGQSLYNQAMNSGNQLMKDFQPGKVRTQALTSGANALGSIQKATGQKSYSNFADKTNKFQDKLIGLSDQFIKKMPEGPFRDVMDKGLIPIPTGNATQMRNMTFLKAMLGPLGKPFKIMSNKEVDAMRQKTIDLTMQKHGLMVDPKTGQIKMNWNQEDINKFQKGGGAYTDNLGQRGAAFNSTLGRFAAGTEGRGNILLSDDRYNFNKSVSEYAGMTKDSLLKGSMSDATYYGASMAARFAQDIGWLNQRALGSRIEIGKVNRSMIDPATGKQKTPAQIKADQIKAAEAAKKAERARQNQRKLEQKRDWWDPFGWAGTGSKNSKAEAKKKAELEAKRKAEIAKSKTTSSSVARPPSPPAPKVTVVRPNTAGGGQGGRRGSTRPAAPPAIRAQSSSRTRNSRATHGIK